MNLSEKELNIIMSAISHEIAEKYDIEKVLLFDKLKSNKRELFLEVNKYACL